MQLQTFKKFLIRTIENDHAKLKKSPNPATFISSFTRRFQKSQQMS